MNFHQERKDSVIRHTDFDALSSRLSAHRLGYFQDPFLQIFVDGVVLNYPKISNSPMSAKRTVQQYFGPNSSSKFPVINRGTYLRTETINKLVESFLESCGGCDCQILSIGAGSDTRAFDLYQKHKNLRYIETDFEISTKLKSSVIAKSAELMQIFEENIDDMKVLQKLGDKFDTGPKEYPSSIELSRYKLVPVDLRNEVEVAKFLAQNCDETLPTLVLSECVLCYIEPSITEKILEKFVSYFPCGAFVTYDPMALNDNFGDVMVENLSKRGINIPALKIYSTMEKQLERINKVLKDETKQRVFVADMEYIHAKWISQEELMRISKLEIFDELEEWNLLGRHYSLSVGVWSRTKQEVFQKYVDKVSVLGWKMSK